MIRLKKISFIILLSSITFFCKYMNSPKEIQLTNDLNKNSDLDDRYNFSPDDKWLVYDTRTESGGIGGCRTIEKVNVETGEIIVLYETKNPTDYGPGVGAPSYSHTENQVVFIHGLPNCNSERPYAQWRRTGVIIHDNEPGKPVFMDARDITFPFTAGALRGGTHQHEWSGDGQWIGFTYNDAIMKSLEDKTGIKWNLRTIGVSRPIKSVKVDRDSAGENNDGTHFSVLVVKVVPNPVPGSDEISHAAEDSWVGTSGYQKPDGSWQRARAFIGTVRDKNNEPVKEVFIVDIPENIEIAGTDGPLEGTETTFPMPPSGTVQRRLTWTANSKYRGCLGFTRCSPDGKYIAYRTKDENGIDQVFFISPVGGVPEQITNHETPVQSAVRWQPDGNAIFYVWNNSIIKLKLNNGRPASNFQRLTQRTDEPPFNFVIAHHGKLIAFNRFVTSGKGKTKQIFLIKLE